MTRTISAVFDNGAFRPTEPIGDLPEHTPVRLTVEREGGMPAGKRVLGLQRGSVIYIAPDLDEELGDGFWFGSKP